MVFDTGDLAGLSFSLAYFFAVCALGFCLVIWKYRKRYSKFWSASHVQRSDTVLNIGFAGFFIVAAYQRFNAALAFIKHEWGPSPLNDTLALFYLIPDNIFLMMLTWWLSLELSTERHYIRWWFLVAGVGIGIGLYVSYVY